MTQGSSHSYLVAIAFAMVLLSLLLMFVTAWGYVVQLRGPEVNVSINQSGIPGYNYATRATNYLERLLATPIPGFDLVKVNNVIFESLVHSDVRMIGIQENWLLWLGGKFYGPLARTQNPWRIVRGGRALCGEAAAVLNAVAEVNGHEARLIGLGGHIVSEIRTASGWRLADPDFGVVYRVGLNGLQGQSGAKLMMEALAARGFGSSTIKNYIRIVQSEEDNVVLEIGSASSPRLHLFEIIAEWLKWAIPLIAFLAGIVWSRALEDKGRESLKNSDA